MFVFFLLVSVLILQNTHSSSIDEQANNLSLMEQVKKIDKTLAEYQVQYQDQERKDATILANVLSELSQTKGDLEKLKTSHNNTVLELTSLQKTYNKTVLDLNETRTELQEIKQLHDKNGRFGFQVKVAGLETVRSPSPIIFKTIMYNGGTLFDIVTGKFTVAVNGTYLIWTSIHYKSNGKTVMCSIMQDDVQIGEATDRSSESFGTASTLTLKYLSQGETVWVKPPTYSTNVTHHSVFGAVLINTD